jgi:anti-sigma factor RsiW
VTHEELQSLLGAYAIDAVEPDEALAVETHLGECPRCRAEVAELREVAALLSHSGADAPAGVWDRIASSLTEVPPPLRLEVQRERRASRGRYWQAIAMGAAAMVLVVLGVSVVRLRGQVDDLRTASALGAGDQSTVALAAAQAMTAPGSRIARLAGDRDDRAVAVVRSDGQGYFFGGALPELDGRIYELWGATDAGQVTSLGTIPGPGVYAFAADPSIGVVMVTEEDAPVPAPTRPAIVTGSLA